MHRLSLIHDTQETVLHGPGVTGTFKGARRAGTGREVTVDLLLEGAPADILADLAALRAALDPGPAPVQLRLQPEAGGAVYETLVLSAGLELPGEGPEARLRGGLAARLRLETPGCWEGEEAELALNGQSGGTPLGNPQGASGCALDIAAGAAAGDLPAPFRLELAHAPGALVPLGDVLVALDARPCGPAAGLLLEGELGLGGAVQADPDCSGGAFARCAAPAGQETRLLTWTLPAALLADCARRPLRAALRLAAGAPGGVSARWELRAGDALLAGTITQRLESGETLALLPALRMPAGEPPAPLSLCLLASSGAALTLDVDFVHLLPQDGFQRLHAVAPLPPGAALVVDGPAGQVFQRGPDGCLPACSAAGAPIKLRPARAQRLYILHPGPVDTLLTARVWLRPRWGQV